jgi:hypothetical protein
MGRSTDEKGADKAQAIRRSQQKDRARILQEIQQSQATIAKYSEERAPLSTELKKIEADVGPIKYIAALAYGEATNDIIDKAVRLVILLIIVVFDPLAILLIIAYNMSIRQKEDFDDTKNFFKRAKENAKKLDEDADFVPPMPSIKEALVEEPEPKKEETVEIRKDNMIVIDEATGESIPPITSSEQQLPKKLEPKYDYDEPYSFREKGK